MPSAGAVLLRRSVLDQRRHLTLASVLAAVHQGGEALVPVLIGVIIDRAVTGGAVADLVLWVGVLAADFLVLSLAYRNSARNAERAAQQAEHALRLRITERVLDPRGGADTTRLPGELVNIATGDARRLGGMQFAIPFGLFAASAGLIVGAVALLRESWLLGVVVLAGAPLIVFGSRWLGKPLQRRSEAEQQGAARASGVAADLVAGLRVLKGIGAQDAAVAKYRETSRGSLAATLRAATARSWHDAGVLILTGLFVTAIALLGVLLTLDNVMGIGGLIAAIGLAQYLFTPFLMFSRLHGALATARGSATRIAAVLDAEPRVVGGSGELPGPVRGELRLRAVRHEALRDLTVDVPAGQLLGVVAPDGRQATALLSCLGREADPEAGTVTVDGVALTDLDPVAVRAAVLVAAHDAELFAGTVASNIGPRVRQPAAVGAGPPTNGHAANGTAAAPGLAVAGPDAKAVNGNGSGGMAVDELAVDEVAVRAAAVDEVAASLPSGLNTAVSERGGSLSGGQRQRIALARALAAAPPVLVLHDPTTAVDAVTEARIATALRELRHGATTVLVTSSPALLAATDRVLLLDDGRVAADGSHAELVRDNATYRAAVLA